MPMTMNGILSKTPQSRRDSSRYVVLKGVKVARTPYKTLKYTAQTYSTHDAKENLKKGKPSVYTTMVETNGRQVVVECGCDDFWAVWEVALNRHKAARIKFSNGELPTDRNPRLRPGCCKHIFKLGSDLMAKGKVT